jgi:hypothetical protein
MPTSTRRQAASHSARISDLNNELNRLNAEEGGLINFLHQGARQQEVHEDGDGYEDGENASDGSGISVGEIDDEIFEGDGNYDMQPETSASH